MVRIGFVLIFTIFVFALLTGMGIYRARLKASTFSLDGHGLNPCLATPDQTGMERTGNRFFSLEVNPFKNILFIQSKQVRRLSLTRVKYCFYVCRTNSSLSVPSLSDLASSQAGVRSVFQSYQQENELASPAYKPHLSSIKTIRCSTIHPLLFKIRT